MEKKASYNFSADLLRAFAIGAVVLIHTANAVYGRPDFFGGSSWWFAIFLNSVSRVAIPLFIMISGYFILQKQESFTASLKRTWNRIGLPCLFWFGVYAIFTNAQPFNWVLLKRLVTVNVFDLYFFVILIGLYIVAPFIRSFLKQATEKEQKLFVGFSLVMGVIIFLSEYLFSFCSPANSFTYWVPYVGLFVAGWYIGTKKILPNVKWQGLVYILSLAVTLIGGYMYFRLHNSGNRLLDAHGCLSYYTDSYLSVNVVAMTLVVFAIGMHARFAWIGEKSRKLLYSIARASLGIYVLHGLFLLVLDSHFKIFDPIAPAWLYVVIKWTVIFGASYLATILLMKIPFVKRVFGETK